MAATLVGNLFSGAFATPALPSLSLGGVAASVVDDAKAKADQLANKASSAASAAGDKVDGAIAAAGTSASKQVSKAAPGAIELYSGKYYYTCALGGAVACGATHAFVTPLDLVKCRKQVDKNLYKSNTDGWKKIYATEGGLRGL
ncbi:hypothetical protein Rhopal_000250-T1 [Rhodotorula paludigena]|uniref:Uncharacterized protein n=1 Tax=Rhodotorula paludigena TaxID=86838 RepID=A0AAV5GDA1_9BASI|nr:hypothetical protein Rhopal_000250-T1 [Rhodotorula paludigena]